MLYFFRNNRNIEEVNQMSPLIWAYIGDCVFELYIRTYLVNSSNLKPHELHIKSIEFVKAKAQAEILKKIGNILTEKEKEIVRRGRNVHTHHIAKNASMQEYMYSTAFEALIGYLYLTNNENRLEDIFEVIFNDKTSKK